MYKLILSAALLLLCSCAFTGANLQAQVAWTGQPEGARGAFLRCVYLMAEKECGSSDLKNPAIQACMTDGVNAYRQVEPELRTQWLVDRGCREDMAQLREGEL